MDDRGKKEAEMINATGHKVIKYVCGVISPELHTPNPRWLKSYHPETWSEAKRFFDLPDYLVYRATGRDVRSVCTTVCKGQSFGPKGARKRRKAAGGATSNLHKFGMKILNRENILKLDK